MIFRKKRLLYCVFELEETFLFVSSSFEKQRSDNMLMILCMHCRVSSIQRVVQLYENYQKLSDILRSGGTKAGGGGGGGKRGRPGASASTATPGGSNTKAVTKSLLSVRMAATLLKALYKYVIIIILFHDL